MYGLHNSSKKSKYYLFNMNLTWITYIFYWPQIITYFQFHFSFWSYSGQVKLPTNQKEWYRKRKEKFFKNRFSQKIPASIFSFFFYIYLQKAPGTLNTTQNTIISYHILSSYAWLAHGTFRVSNHFFSINDMKNISSRD